MRARTRAVGPAIALALDDPTLGGKFLGTTHMMMLGTNNLEVFDLLLKFADENIPNPIVQNSCPPGLPAGKGKNG